MINRVIYSRVYGRFLKMGFKIPLPYSFQVLGKELTLLSQSETNSSMMPTWRHGLKVKCLMLHTHEIYFSKYLFSKQNCCSLVFVKINMMWSKVRLFILEIWWCVWQVLFQVCQNKYNLWLKFFHWKGRRWIYQGETSRGSIELF